jgi:hypothetical protein
LQVPASDVSIIMFSAIVGPPGLSKASTIFSVLAESTDQASFDVVWKAHLKLLARYDAAQVVVIDRIIRSNEQLRASDQTKYLELEHAAFEALCELWPQARRRKALRMVAMVSAGALRLAIDSWAAEQGRKPLADYLKEALAGLKAELREAWISPSLFQAGVPHRALITQAC